MSRLSRRHALALGTAALAAPSVVRSQGTYPAKTIRIVVPFAAGSATDLTARGLGAKLQELTSQSVIIENKPGAGGQLGAQTVAAAPADGYTLLMGTNSTNAANVSLYKKLIYDPAKDFAPIARVVMGVNVLVVNPDVPAKTTAELIAYAKANPGKLNYAEASSSQRLSAEQFNQLAGVKIERVPYKSSPEAVRDVIAGQVQVMFPDLPQGLTQIRADKLRGLGVTGAKRTKIAPDLPAIAETVPGYELTYWLAVFAPAATPAPIQKALHDLVVEAMKDEKTGQTMTQGRMEVSVLGLQQFDAFVKAETAKWAKMIKDAGIQPE
ncbi:MAG: tripartite tricarboxylate transporter substrate binding protein [Alphaproteobacteria bacterium]|nr:tripartite tricarboxylate transporter substrate binding protein [Alphaproteobacteria bacterium]MCW5743113.1 tripartite tricarboxylate transporter substrate binding protein [Alphaproteobacteria bacterium]